MISHTVNKNVLNIKFHEIDIYIHCFLEIHFFKRFRNINYEEH